MPAILEKENTNVKEPLIKTHGQTEETIIEMMLSSVHSMKGKLIKLEEKLIKACSS